MQLKYISHISHLSFKKIMIIIKSATDSTIRNIEILIYKNNDMKRTIFIIKYL